MRSPALRRARRTTRKSGSAIAVQPSVEVAMPQRVGVSQTAEAPPTVRFFRLIADAPMPVRADRSVGGTVPTRAFRYCEPLRTASAFGWYVFPPIDFSLTFDGVDTRWSLDGGDTWQNLDSIQYPGFSDLFNEHCPAVARDCAPPLLAVGAEPGIIAVWSGLIARTAPGWSLLVRPPANLPRSNRYDSYEGIIETDRWTGPLFTNIRLTKTDVPIEFKRETPSSGSSAPTGNLQRRDSRQLRCRRRYCRVPCERVVRIRRDGCCAGHWYKP